MSYRDFYNDIKHKQLASLYLLYGSERLMIDRMLENLVETTLNPALSAFNYIVKSGKELSFNEAMDAVERLPMMDDRLVVVIDDADFLNSTQWSDEAKLSFVNYHQDKTTLTTILIVETIDKRKKLFKQLKKVAKVIEFGRLDELTLAKWLIQEAARFDKTMSMNIAIQLVNKLGYTNKDSELDLYAVRSTLQRICYLSKGADVDEKSLAEVVDNSLESNIFKMVDALFEGRAAYAFEQFSKLLQTGEVAIKISFMIHRHIRQLLKIKYLADVGYSAKSIESALGIKGFVVRKALGQLKKLSKEDLLDLLSRAADCDLQLKSSLDGNVAVENLMASIVLMTESV